jgi:cation transport protein ChaC
MERSCDLWIFAYGSLMWRPGFAFEERHPARLRGFHRRFCIVSRHHRGSFERPGLVLGLDRGGATQGVAYRVAAHHAGDVLRRVRARELISGVYREALLTVTLLGEDARQVAAIVYLAEPHHPSFNPRLPVKLQAHIIAHAHGRSGDNLGYLASTVGELLRLGIRERELERIATCLGAVRTRQLKPDSRKSHHTGRRVMTWPRLKRVRFAELTRFQHRTRLR